MFEGSVAPRCVHNLLLVRTPQLRVFLNEQNSIDTTKPEEGSTLLRILQRIASTVADESRLEGNEGTTGLSPGIPTIRPPALSTPTQKLNFMESMGIAHVRRLLQTFPKDRFHSSSNPPIHCPNATAGVAERGAGEGKWPDQWFLLPKRLEELGCESTTGIWGKTASNARRKDRT